MMYRTVAPLAILLLAAASEANSVARVTDRASNWSVPTAQVASRRADLGIGSFPQHHIPAIRRQVEGLVSSGALHRRQADKLTQKLDTAIDKLGNGRVGSAIDRLKSFLQRVRRYVARGILTPEQGERLIDAAESAIAALSA